MPNPREVSVQHILTISVVQIGTVVWGSTVTFDIKTKRLIFFKVIPFRGIAPKETIPNT